MNDFQNQEWHINAMETVFGNGRGAKEEKARFEKRLEAYLEAAGRRLISSSVLPSMEQMSAFLTGIGGHMSDLDGVTMFRLAPGAVGNPGSIILEFDPETPEIGIAGVIGRLAKVLGLTESELVEEIFDRKNPHDADVVETAHNHPKV
jgi:hypothetical protein